MTDSAKAHTTHTWHRHSHSDNIYTHKCTYYIHIKHTYYMHSRHTMYIEHIYTDTLQALYTLILTLTHHI